MNFSGISNQNILGKLLRSPLKLIPPMTVMPIMQGKLRGKKWIVGSGQHGSWLGSYEYEKQLLFQQIVTEGSVVYDIGSHSGFYTLLASVLVGRSGKVVAFEPNPNNLYYLKEHLQLNHIENVIVIEAAVSDSRGEVSFVGSGFTGHISSQGEFSVKTVALDELINLGEIPIPNFLKIDIEGAEILALSGAKSLLRKFRPTILLATHGSEVHQESCDFLESLGYQLEAVYGGSLQESNELIACFNR
jgi:FkbM family methyltransferase